MQNTRRDAKIQEKRDYEEVLANEAKATEDNLLPDTMGHAAKPARNTNRVPAPAQPIVHNVPKMHLDRVQTQKAKESGIMMSLDGSAYTDVQYSIPFEHDYKECLKEAYWVQVVHKFAKAIVTEGNYSGSIIHVRPPDLRFYARLFVKEVSSRGLVVHQLEYVEMGLQKLARSAHLAVWNAALRGYDVVRKQTGDVIGGAKDFKSLDEVENWLSKFDA